MKNIRRYFKRAKFFLLLLFIYFAGAAPAQELSTLSGKLRTKGTGSPLAGAEILLRPGHRGTITDKEGYFEFVDLKPGNYTVEVDHVGYKTLIRQITVKADNNEPLQLTMEKDVRNIPGVEIVDMAFQNDPYQKTTIKPKLIRRMPARDAGDFLRSQPNISGIHKGGGNIDPVIRGFKFAQLNVQSNSGQKVEGGCPNRMDPALSHIDINNVKKIEIIKGPYALRYGPAFGAVLNLTTKNAGPYENFQVHAEAMAGWESNWNGNKQHLMITGGNDKVYFALGGNNQNYGDYTAGNGETIPSSFKKWNYSAELGLNIRKNHQFGLAFENSFGSNARFPTLAMDEREEHTKMLSADYHYLNHSRVLHSVDAKVYYSDVNHEMDNKWRPFSDTVVAVSNIEAKTTGGRLDFGLHKNAYMMHFGSDFEHIYKDGQRVKSLIMQPGLPEKTEDLWSDAHINNFGFFAEYKRLQNIRLDWVLAARIDLNTGTSDPLHLKNMTGNDIYYNDTTDSDFVNISVSAGITWRFHRSFSLDVAVGRGVRSPDMVERFIILLPVGYDNYDYLGNPQLKPENNQQADLTLKYTNETWGQMSLNGFFSWVTDYITGIKVPPSEIMPQTKGVLGVKRFENIDDAYLYGFEYSWITPAELRWGGSLTAAMTSGINPNAVRYIVENGQVVGSEIVKNDPLPEIPPFEANIRVHYYWFDRKLMPEVNLRFVAAQNHVSQAYDERTTPGFFLAGINAVYKANTNLSFAGGITNIFNNAYYEHLNRRIIGSKADLYEPGISFYLNVNVNF